MKRSVSWVAPALVAFGLLLSLGSASVLAQGTTKKATKAAKPGASKTISGSAGKGKLLTFNELEACLKEQDGLKLRPPELQKQRDAMEAERQTIQKQADTLKTESEALNKLSERVKDFNARMRTQGDKVKSWKDRDEEFATANKNGPAADRQRKDLEREREDLQKTEAALDQESKTLSAEREQLAASFNERAVAQETAATDWNARSRKLDAGFQSYEDDRLDWKSRCADRPYLEEWEK